MPKYRYHIRACRHPIRQHNQVMIVNIRIIKLKNLWKLIVNRNSRRFNTKHIINLLNIIAYRPRHVNIVKRQSSQQIRPRCIQHPCLLLNICAIYFNKRIRNLSKQYTWQTFNTSQHNIVQHIVLEIFQNIYLIWLIKRQCANLLLWICDNIIKTNAEHQVVGIIVGIHTSHLLVIHIL